MNTQPNYDEAKTTVSQSNILSNYNLRHYSRLRRVSSRVSHGNRAESVQTSASGPQNSVQSLQNPTETYKSLHATATSNSKPLDVISLLEDQIASINRQMAQEADPAKLQQLSRAVTLLRRQRKSELSSRRLSYRHLQDQFKRRKKKSDVDQIADLDPLKLYAILQKWIERHPNMAQLTAKQIGIDNATESMSILRQIVNDQERKKQLAEFVSNQLIEFIRVVIAKLELGNSTSTKSQQTTPQPAPGPGQQPILYNVGGRLIDPTKPYPVQ